MIRLAVMLYVRIPLSLQNVDDLLHERGIEVSHGMRPSTDPASQKMTEHLVGVVLS